MPDDAAHKRMSWRAIVQVCLLNIAVGLILVPINSTLNRVMIYELGLAATLVAVLISLRFISSPLKVWFGCLSDTHPIGGRHRTWYIAGGVLVMAIGLVAAPYAALSIPRLGWLGIVASFIAFGLIGVGVNPTTALYLAIVADQSDDKQRPRIAATMFIVLGLAMVVTSIVIGQAVEPYSEQRLIAVMVGTAIVGLVLTAIGLFRLEPRTDGAQSCSTSDSNRARWRSVRRLLVGNREAIRFFIYLVFSFVAIEAQQVILEPYAARFFGMTPGETTRLDGFYRLTELVMLGVGAYLFRRIGHRPTASIGIGVAVVALLLVIASGPLGQSSLLLIGVLVLGLGAGLMETTNMALTMTVTDARHAGMFMGAWGLARAVGIGGGNIIGGVLRDVGLLLSGSHLTGYVTAFAFEIVVLLLAVPVLWRISISHFRSAAQTAIETMELEPEPA
jgi:BCD family chlorophyll transporter-like MFS transporter